MSEATPFALSKLFSDLLDRKVSVIDASDKASSDARKAYAVYDVAGSSAQIVLQVDFDLLGSLGGLLAGLPEVLVRERLKQNPQEETLRDAMHEVLNITSAVMVTEGRAILRQMELDEAKGRMLAKDLNTLRMSKNRFLVTIPSYTGGQIACYAPFA